MFYSFQTDIRSEFVCSRQHQSGNEYLKRSYLSKRLLRQSLRTRTKHYLATPGSREERIVIDIGKSENNRCGDTPNSRWKYLASMVRAESDLEKNPKTEM